MIMLALALGSADARRRGHHHGHGRAVETLFGQSPEEAAAVPPGWRLMPPDPNWSGKRYLSPDGASWFATYASPVGDEAIGEHMKMVAFADGEEVTYLRGERGWIAVSGLKGDRIFYRKAVLACGGRLWRHVAFEYPAEAKRRMDRFAMHRAAELDADLGCDRVTSSR